MIDATTQQPMRVLKGNAGPYYIRLLTSQLSHVRQLLDQHGVRYSVDEYTISLDGGPVTTIVYLSRGTDGPSVQTILDNGH